MSATEQLRAALEGRYTIEREIGRGGMATVYLARDLRHHRLVALKLLDPELGAVLGVERFLAEIRVTANLQHPNLLPLFDSGEAGGLLYYVMPFVEGESLRARLEREKQLPVDEAVRIAIAVAGALDYAHRHAVVHRDLKPENILLHEGQPLVADFGIALAVSKAGGARITQTGLSLGTPQYMSPEQATGDRVIDGRTDVYSLGAVLYEMLSGDPPHTGSTVQAVIAKLLTDAPRPVRTLRPAVPPQVDHAIGCALEKLPADRFATAREFAEALTGARAVASPSGVVTPASAMRDLGAPRSRAFRRARAAVPWALAAAAVALSGWAVMRPPREGAPRARFVLSLPDSLTLVAPGPVIALSPDGSLLAISPTVRGTRRIYLRALDGLEFTSVGGSEGAQRIAFSPDGRWLAFVADDKLKKVPVAGGPPTTIADSVAMFSWGDRDDVVFSRGGNGGLWRVSAAGGTPELLVAPDSARGEISYMFPFVLPGSRAALFGINTGDALAAKLAVVGLDDRRITRLGVLGLHPRLAPSGHLLFSRVDDGTILAAPFDARRLRLTGDPVPVLQRVLVRRAGATDFALSGNGVLAYLEGSQVREPVLLDEAKRERPLLPGVAPQFYHHPRLSPDGRRVAVAIREPGGGSDIWVIDIESGARTRLTSDGESDRPEWMADGRRLLWLRADGPRREIRSRPWDDSAEESVLLGSEANATSAVPSHRGDFLVYASFGARQGLGLARLDSPRTTRAPVATRASELMPTISPDDRWVAYQSNESGRSEVYARPLDRPGARYPVSVGGGSEPVWSPSGKQIFYRPIERVLSAATVETVPEFRVVRRDTVVHGAYSGDFVTPNYDVSRDGRQLLVLKYTDGDARLIVATAWLDELRERMAQAARRR